MNIYGMGTDSILLCYLADYELHQNEGGAKSIPATLKEFLHEYAWIHILLFLAYKEIVKIQSPNIKINKFRNIFFNKN